MPEERTGGEREPLVPPLQVPAMNRINRLSEVGLSSVTFQHEPSRARYPHGRCRDVKG